MKNLIEKIIAFRDERNWEQFHNIKDLLIGINMEVGELQEIFLWAQNEQEVNLTEVKHELADIFIFLIYISEKFKINLEEAVLEKIKIHKKHYPIKKSKNKTIKYNKLNNEQNA